LAAADEDSAATYLLLQIERQTAAPAEPARPLGRRRQVGASGGGGRGLRRHLHFYIS